MDMNKINHFLAARAWAGVSGVCAVVLLLIAALGLMYQEQLQELDRELGQLAEALRKHTTHPVPTRPPSSPARVAFSVSQRVRCPGGGDWLGRERNRREARVEFRAPEGRVIVQPAHIRVVDDNDGRHGPIEYLDHNEKKEATRVRASLSCNPPNHPGAKGGWMEIELYGTHKQASQ